MKQKRNIVMYREHLLDEGELEAIRKHFDARTQTRMKIRAGDLVIGRCSVVPFYSEIARDIEFVGGRLINSLYEHQYVADLGEYVSDLGDMTPETWSRLEDVPYNAGPFVLKGATNSKKQQWKTHMYADDWRYACEVYSRLEQDGLIGEQRIYVRRYVPLKKLADIYGYGPVTKEFRFFVYRGEVLSGGFYWHSFEGDVIAQGNVVPSTDDVPKEFLREAIDRVKDKIPFFAIDVAEGEGGRWWVIELNDAQMSGLSANDPHELYANLKRCLENE